MHHGSSRPIIKTVHNETFSLLLYPCKMFVRYHELSALTRMNSIGFTFFFPFFVKVLTNNFYQMFEVASNFVQWKFIWPYLQKRILKRGTILMSCIRKIRLSPIFAKCVLGANQILYSFKLREIIRAGKNIRLLGNSFQSLLCTPWQKIL